MNLKFHKNCDYTGKILKISCVRCISMKFDIHFLGLPFTIAFFAAVNHNNDHKQRTLQHRNIPNGLHSTNHKSQTMIFWTRLSKVLFPKRPAKMNDSSEKHKRQLAFELQNSRVFEKRS